MLCAKRTKTSPFPEPSISFPPPSMIHPKLRRFLPLALFALALVVSCATGFGQDEAPPEHKDTNIFQTIREGGPLIMAIWLAIVGTSVTMVTFIIQNIMSLRKDK